MRLDAADRVGARLPGERKDEHVKSILIADADAAVRAELKKQLTSRSLSVIEASSAAQALQLLRTNTIDLFIADAELPDLDGYALLAKIRAAGSLTLRGLPIVLLFKDDSERQRAKAMMSGASGVLKKPLGPTATAELVGRLLPSVAASLASAAR